MAKERGEVSPEEIAAAMERYPGIPYPLAVAKYKLDEEMLGGPLGELCAGSSWGGVHLERVGFLVQKIAEAVYHQLRKSITIKLEATDYPDTYDHWEISIKEVEGVPPDERQLHPLLGWPCCSCEAAISMEDHHPSVVMLDKVARWEYPTWGNVLAGTGGRALAVLCDKCSHGKQKARFAVKKDRGKFVLVLIKELEDINGRQG